MTHPHPLASSDARRRPFARDQRGAALVEFALVVGIFVMILYGLVYFGMALATKQRVTNAAAEGARAAVGAATASDAQTIAQNRVIALLGDATDGRYHITPVAAPCNAAVPTGSQCVTVTISYDWANHPVVPAAPGLGIVRINTLVSSATVQYSG